MSTNATNSDSGNEEESAPLEGATAKHILLVEDDRIMSDVLRRSLQCAGLEVTLARTGREAQEVSQTDHFDVVVTDYGMPEMNGEEFLRGMRQASLNSDIPAIFVTGKGLELDTERLRQELGVFEFISKPFGPRHLIDTIQTCLAEESQVAACRSRQS